MYLISILSMSMLFDYTPTESSAKADRVDLIMEDGKWSPLIKTLKEDLNLILTSSGKALYKDQKKLVTVTQIDDKEGEAPIV